MSPEARLIQSLQHPDGKKQIVSTETGLLIHTGQTPEGSHTTTGLWIPQATGQRESTTEVHPKLADFSPNGTRLHLPEIHHRRARETDARRKYLVESNGTNRFDTENQTVKEAVAYANDYLTKSIILAEDVHGLILKKTHTPGRRPTFVPNGVINTEDIKARLIEEDSLRYDRSGRYILPHNWIAANNGFFKIFFNWDSDELTEWAVNAGTIVVKPEKTINGSDLGKDMMNNFGYIFDRKGYNPNAAKDNLDNRAQPPRWTNMINTVHKAVITETGETTEDAKWYQSMMRRAKKEYWQVWNLHNEKNVESGNRVFNHRVSPEISDTMLAHYGDTDIGYDKLAELESGWDTSDRWDEKCAEFLAVDLNSYLVKYEKDFEGAAQSEREALYWRNRRTERSREIYQLNFDKKRGFFTDHNYKTGEHNQVLSLAGVLAMNTIDILDERELAITPEDTRRWKQEAQDKLNEKPTDTEWEKKKQAFLQRLITKTPLSSHEQIKDQIVTKLLADFVNPYGVALTDTDPKIKGKPQKQWNWPNQFANITDQVIEELEEAGYLEEAAFIAETFVFGQTEYHLKHGKIPEKINTITGEMGTGAEYADQHELGMSAAAYLKYVRKLPEMYDRLDQQKQNKTIHEPVILFSVN